MYRFINYSNETSDVFVKIGTIRNNPETHSLSNDETGREYKNATSGCADLLARFVQHQADLMDMARLALPSAASEILATPARPANPTPPQTQRPTAQEVHRQ
jgi:hypothetical protein